MRAGVSSRAIMFSLVVLLWTASRPRAQELDAVPELPPETPAPAQDTFLEPNSRDTDGAAAYVHLTADQMPLRVSIGYPKLGIQHGTREDGRNAAIEGLREWESALSKRLLWFALEIVVHDPSAPVQVEWRRRLSGSASGHAAAE